MIRSPMVPDRMLQALARTSRPHTSPQPSAPPALHALSRLGLLDGVEQETQRRACPRETVETALGGGAGLGAGGRSHGVSREWHATWGHAVGRPPVSAWLGGERTHFAIANKEESRAMEPRHDPFDERNGQAIVGAFPR